MEMTAIKRESAPAPSLNDESIALGQKAEEVLGYSALKKANSACVETAELQLAHGLKVIGVEILNLADVKRYQFEHMRDVAKRKFAEWLNSSDLNTFYCPAWGLSKISEYREPVPQFVLNKAIQIKEAVPQCDIFIEYLNESPDPFLVAQIRKEKIYDWGKCHEVVESYYVEVWDEPKFESTL